MRYKGTYKLRTPIDLRKNTFPREYTGLFADNDIYIECQNNIKIYHYGKQILQAYIPSLIRGRKIVKSIKDAFHGEIISGIEETDSEVLFKFNAKYLDDLSQFLKPKTSSASRSPFSTKNLPKAKYVIPESDLKEYKKIISHIGKENVLKISVVAKSFLYTLCNKKYTYEMIKEDMSLKCLRGKEYIHSIGKWEEYLKFLEKEFIYE